MVSFAFRRARTLSLRQDRIRPTVPKGYSAVPRITGELLDGYSWGRVIMRVADILRIKGSTVKTVTPDETALELSEKLHDRER